MKINLDDPRLTAYALGELSGEEKVMFEKAVAESEEAWAFVKETRQMAGLVRDEFQADLARGNEKPRNIMPLPETQSFWSDARWASIGLAAVLAIATVIAALMFSNYRPVATVSTARPEADVQMEILSDSQTAYAESSGGQFEEKPFLSAATNPVSTFSLAPDTASYPRVRQFIDSGSLPPKDAVQIEGMINYFTYDYPQPQGDEPFSIHLEAATCPWQPAHRLVRIGLKAREMAREVRVEVEFNPARVDSYRLIGYERRAGTKKDVRQDKTDVAEVRAGQSVTALYEVIARDAPVMESDELLTVLLQFKRRGAQRSELMERSLTDEGGAFQAASADFKFAAAVAQFGMMLRDSPHKGEGTFETVLRWAEEGKGSDPASHRAGFIALVQKAQALAF